MSRVWLIGTLFELIEVALDVIELPTGSSFRKAIATLLKLVLAVYFLGSALMIADCCFTLLRTCMSIASMLIKLLK